MCAVQYRPSLYGVSNLGIIIKTLKLFKALVKLDLGGKQITCLRFLNPYLVDENCALQSLRVDANWIGTVKMKRFISRLYTP